MIVTLVKVKKDLIEFQLAGGGFGTFGDDTSTSVSIPDARKTEREKDLEKRIDDESDRNRRRSLQRELDNLATGATARTAESPPNASASRKPNASASPSSVFAAVALRPAVPQSGARRHPPPGVGAALGEFVDFGGRGPDQPCRQPATSPRCERG